MAHAPRTRAQQVCSALLDTLGQQIQTCLQRPAEDFVQALGETDRALGVEFRKVEALRKFAVFHRPAEVMPFQFGNAFRQWNPSTDGTVLGFGADDDLPLMGDSDQLFTALDMLVSHAREAGTQAFELRVHAQTDPPNLLLVSPSHQEAPWSLSFGFGLNVDDSALNERWSEATQGGSVRYRSPDTLELTLRGAAPWDRGDEAFQEAERMFYRAERTLRPWRNVIGTTESGYYGMEDGATLYADILRRAVGHLEGAMACLEMDT